MNQKKTIKIDPNFIDKIEIKASNNSLSTKLNNYEEHRLTLRLPLWIIKEIDIRRKKYTGKISRTLWIIRQIERALQNK